MFHLRNFGFFMWIIFMNISYDSAGKILQSVNDEFRNFAIKMCPDLHSGIYIALKLLWKRYEWSKYSAYLATQINWMFIVKRIFPTAIICHHMVIVLIIPYTWYKIAKKKNVQEHSYELFVWLYKPDYEARLSAFDLER